MNSFVDILLAPFFARALLGGLAAAILTSFLGIHVVMRRNSLFGDAIAHAALVGVAIGIWWQIDPFITTLAVAVLVGAILPVLEERGRLPLDNWLGALLPTAMGFGVIILALRPGYQPDLIAYLFGNILAISLTRLWWLLGCTALTLAVLWKYRQSLLLVSFDQTLAQVAGIKVRRLQIIFNVLLAITVTLGVQVVGAVLVNALLVVPASFTRLWANSVKALFIWTPIVSALLVVLGLLLSAAFNLPSGPAIAVLGGTALLIASWVRGR